MAQQTKTKSKASRSSSGGRTSARNSRSRTGPRRVALSHAALVERKPIAGDIPADGILRAEYAKVAKQEEHDGDRQGNDAEWCEAAGAPLHRLRTVQDPKQSPPVVGLVGVAGGIALGRGTKSEKSLSVPLSGRSAKATSKKFSGAAKNVCRRGANRPSCRTRAPAESPQSGEKLLSQVAGQGRTGGTHQAQGRGRNANLTSTSEKGGRANAGEFPLGWALAGLGPASRRAPPGRQLEQKTNPDAN